MRWPGADRTGEMNLFAKPGIRRRLCLRHTVDLYSAAFGSLLDLTGRSYAKWSVRVLNEARACERCLRRAEPPPDLR